MQRSPLCFSFVFRLASLHCQHCHFDNCFCSINCATSKWDFQIFEVCERARECESERGRRVTGRDFGLVNIDGCASVEIKQRSEMNVYICMVH